MVTQLEDCTGRINVTWPQFDFVSLFHYSGGHSKKRIGGLDVSAMNKEVGGAQPIMRNMKIKAEDGFLLPFDQIISVGEEEGMLFLPTYLGPFWMMEME
jgi:hypothetical protein